MNTTALIPMTFNGTQSLPLTLTPPLNGWTTPKPPRHECPDCGRVCSNPRGVQMHRTRFCKPRPTPSEGQTR